MVNVKEWPNIWSSPVASLNPGQARVGVRIRVWVRVSMVRIVMITVSSGLCQFGPGQILRTTITKKIIFISYELHFTN